MSVAEHGTEGGFGTGLRAKLQSGETPAEPRSPAEAIAAAEPVIEAARASSTVEKTTLASLDYERLRELKRMGFSDRRLATLLKCSETEMREHRHALGLAHRLLDGLLDRPCVQESRDFQGL